MIDLRYLTCIDGLVQPKRRMSIGIDSRSLLKSFAENTSQDFEDFGEVDTLASKLDNKMTWVHFLALFLIERPMNWCLKMTQTKKVDNV